MSVSIKTPVVQTELICSECGNRVSIWRKKHKQKEDRHVKTMWCYKCKKETNHIEIRNPIFLQDVV